MYDSDMCGGVMGVDRYMWVGCVVCNIGESVLRVHGEWWWW